MSYSVDTRRFHVWWGPTLWFTDSNLFSVSSWDMSRWAKRAFSGVFYKGPDPIHEGSTPWPNHLPKLPPPNPITLQIRVRGHIFEKHSSFYIFWKILWTIITSFWILDRIHQWSHLDWPFLSSKFKNYQCYFFTCYRSIKISYFILS